MYMPKIPHYICSDLHRHRLLSLCQIYMHYWPETPVAEKQGGNLVKSWVIPLSWDFLVSRQTHPSKYLCISTFFGAPVSHVGDKFGPAPAGLGFRRRGSPERRNGTKRQGRPYHVCTGVIRVVDDKASPTLSVWSFTSIDLSLSLSLS